MLLSYVNTDLAATKVLLHSKPYGYHLLFNNCPCPFNIIKRFDNR